MKMSVAGRARRVFGYAWGMADHANRPLRILGLEPFDTGSHRVVRESISRHSRHQWSWLTRPGRAWKWRMRLGAIELLDQLDPAHDPVDVVFATSLLGFADLRGLWSRARREDAAFVLYLHENQAAYPDGNSTEQSRQRDAHFALTNLTSVLAADLSIFNSHFNRDSFIQGIQSLLAHAPDSTLGDVGGRITASSVVIWPPVEPPPPPERAAVGERLSPRFPGDPVRVLWPHRWEHDKGPEELLEIARRHTEAANLRWTILGESFRKIPPAMEAFQREFADRIDHVGYVEDRAEFWRHLRACDWVLSTARHEYFGIAVIEAMLAGCLPWLPDRLSYREILPDVAKGFSPLQLPADPQAMRDALRTHLMPALAKKAVGHLDDAIGHLVARR